MPKVSVIMAVFNTEKFLPDAIESILYQDFSDFEFLILDDCSTDNSYKILQKYAQKDIRIKIFQNSKNMWISYTRNRLIELSSADFIVTQDSDDMSFWNRLSLQYDFLQKNPDFAVVSGNNVIINEKGNVVGKRKYSDDISKNILKKSPISQPSSMFRKQIFYEVGGYNKNLDYAEDYDLWLKMYQKWYKIKNLWENLIYYRIRSGQTKSEKLKKTLKNTIFIQKNAIKNGLKPSISDRIYIFLEQILLLLPDKIILKIFTFLHYKNEK